MPRYLLGRRHAVAWQAARRRSPLRGLRTLQAARTLAATILLGAASSSWSLGLGDIELDSALNEKLSAEIELLDAGGLQPTEVIVSLASAEDFERVGVERFFFLTDLRFEVAFGAGGVRNIRVFSTQPITEPYLNFLVEVLWPSGRMLKEYTLLLDPPTFSPAPAPRVSAPSQSGAGDSGAGQVQRETAATSSGTRVQLAPPRQRQPSPLDQGVVDGEYRMTDRSDTLWAIAAATRPSEAVSVQQNMLAIQRLNPNAFLNDNINLLKAGYSLRLPSESEALSLSNTDAGRQVAMQNEDWRALRRGDPVPSRDDAEQQAVAQAEPAGSDLRAPVDATPAATQRPTTPTAASDGELRIVAGAGDSVAGGTDPVTAEQLNAAREEQDRLNRELSELNDALAQEKEIASNQIAVKDRQIEVRDQQIAEMQAELERLREDMQQAQAGASQSQNQSASGSQAWWQSPYVLGGGAGVVVLLLVYGLISARRRRADEAFYPDEADEPFEEEAPVPPQPARREPAVAAAPAVAGAAMDSADGDAAVADMESEEPAAGSQTSDVIGEADIYIAYGRYPQAIGLLLGVLDEDPDRNDVRLKLLELYAETRDREAFDTHMAELVERCDDDEALLTARELSQQFGGDEPELETVSELDTDLGSDLDTGLDADEQPVADLDEAATEVAAETPESAHSAFADDSALRQDSAPEDIDFAATAAGEGEAEEFELELDEAAGAAEPSGDSLGGDLGIDFDPERDRNGEAAHADADELSATDDLDLDLDLDDADALADDAFDFGEDGDTASTKLDLARAYIDMGDQDGARDILNEVVSEGNAEQQQRAQAMLEEL